MECKSTKSKNPKSVVPAKQFSSQVQYSEPNKKLQINFGGPILDERGNVIYLLASRKILKFSKRTTACIFGKANSPNVTKCLEMCTENDWVPRATRLDEAKCLVGNQVRNCLTK